MRIGIIILSTVFLGFLSSTNYVLAADIENGRKLAKKCSVCHGKFGIGNDPEVPHIAGQSAFYIEKSLIDYQTGKREDRRMTLMAKPLSKEEIKDLAAWFESLRITLVEPAD